MNHPTPERHELEMSDGALVMLRRYGQPGKPRLVLSHGNGLAIDGYASFWMLLCADFDVVVFDMRNHGVNPTHEQSQHHFARFAQDMQEIWDGIKAAFGDKPSVGVFHSMSAVASVAHLNIYGPACDALVLFDPPVYPPSGHPLEAIELADMHDLAARTRRRPEQYDSPDTLAAQFSRRRAFSGWVPGAAQALAAATLRHSAAGKQWVLACPREFEARIYETNNDADVWRVLAAPLPLPVMIVGGDPELEGQGPPALLCAALAKISSFDYIALPGTSHFLQIEQPEQCVAQIKRFIAAQVPSCAS